MREALKKIKAYYAKFNLEYDYEVLALASDNTLGIRTQINYNKRMHSGTIMAEL